MGKDPRVVEIEMKFNVKEKFIGTTRGKVRL